MSNIKTEAIFYPDYAGSKAYRIPSMITTTKGTVIAGIDAGLWTKEIIRTKLKSQSDAVKTMVKRLIRFKGLLHMLEKDWMERLQLIRRFCKMRKQVRFLCFYMHTPGGIGLWASEPGVGFDAEGNRKLFDGAGNVFLLLADGKVTDSDGNATDYTVDKEGYVFKGGIAQGNIFYKKGH